jgi:hypothetical protein
MNHWHRSCLNRLFGNCWRCDLRDWTIRLRCRFGHDFKAPFAGTADDRRWCERCGVRQSAEAWCASTARTAAK